MGLLLMLPLCGFAQKGMQGVGGSLGFGVCMDGDCDFASGSIRYQNHLTNRMRIVATLEYFDVSGFDSAGLAYHGGVSFNCFFNDVARLRPYALFGLSLGEYEYYDRMVDGSLWGEEIYSMGSFGLNFGIGIDYRISYHISMQAEWVNLFSSFVDDVFSSSLGIGLTYTF